MPKKLLSLLAEEITEQGFGRYFKDSILSSGQRIGDVKSVDLSTGKPIDIIIYNKEIKDKEEKIKKEKEEKIKKEKEEKEKEENGDNNGVVYSSTIGTFDTTPLEMVLGNIFKVPTNKGGTYGWRGRICNSKLKDRNRYDYTHWHAGRDYSGMGRKWVITLKDGVISAKDGMCFSIKYNDGDTSRICHATDVVGNVGHKVFAGEIVCKIGDIGSKDSVHLHWELYPNGVSPTNYLVPKLITKYTQNRRCNNENINLSNPKAYYYINGTRVTSIDQAMILGGARTQKENYDKIYVIRTDIDPNGHEKNYVKYINSNITKKAYDEALKKYKTISS